MKRNKNKVELNQPIEQPKPKSVKPKQIGQSVNNVVKLMLYGAVIVVMIVGLLWSLSGVSQPLSTAQEPTTESTPIAEMTIEAVVNMVNGYCDSGDIKGPGLCNSLLSKLEAAIEARDRGQPDVACNQLNAFINEVEAQNENKIPAEVATELIDAAGSACATIEVTVTPEVTGTPVVVATATVTATNEVTPTQTPEPTPTNTTDYSQLPFPMPSPIGTTENGDYIYNFPPYIETFTPSPPTPTYTPTPVPALKVISYHQVPLDEMKQLVGTDDPFFELIGWTVNNQLILQRDVYTNNDGKIEKVGVEGRWVVAPFTGQATTLENWSDPDQLNAEQQTFLDNLISQKRLPEGFTFGKVLPHGQKLALASMQGKVYIYEINDLQPKLVLPTEPYQDYFLYGPTQWSPDGTYIAYPVGLKTDEYGLRPEKTKLLITNVQTNETHDISLFYDSQVQVLSWSPNNSYLAFTASLSPQAPVHLYVINQDGTGMVDLTPFRSENFEISKWSWSPNGTMLAYKDASWSTFIILVEEN